MSQRVYVDSLEAAQMYVVELTEAAKAAPGPLGLVRIRHKAPDGDVAAAFADAQRGAEDAQQ